MCSVLEQRTMKRNLTILLTLLFIGFVGLGIYDLRGEHQQLQVREIKLQDSVLELNQVKLEKQLLNDEFEKAIDEKEINEEKARKLEEEKLKLERKADQLERDLRAKASGVQDTSSRVAGASTSHSVSGNKATWLRSSGIPESQWWAVDSIVSRESGWRPQAINASSGACGLAQALPCSKLPCALTDPVCHLKWQHGYVKARYGGYPQAVAFWNANHWY